MSEKGDLISREAVIDWFRCYGHMDEPIPFETLVSDLRDAIPSVDAAPMKRGRWERKRSNVYCTACGKGYRITNGGPNVMTFVYCPMCGARMDGKEDGADHE